MPTNSLLWYALYRQYRKETVKKGVRLIFSIALGPSGSAAVHKRRLQALALGCIRRLASSIFLALARSGVKAVNAFLVESFSAPYINNHRLWHEVETFKSECPILRPAYESD